MRAFVRHSLEMLGATVREVPGDELKVSVEAESRAVSLFEHAGEHRLAFSMQRAGSDALPVVPGSRILENLNAALSNDSARHGSVSPKVEISRKSLQKMFRIIAGKVTRFSCRSAWETTVVCYVKTAVSGDELVEELITVEVPFRGRPAIRPDGYPVSESVRWLERPPLKCYRFKEMVENGMAVAERAAIERAEDSRNMSLKRLYETLSRLKGYYEQVKQEATGDENEVKTADAEKAYQYRKTEEIQQTAVRVKLGVKAVETLSYPVKNLTWTLENRNSRRDVRAVFNCFDGKVTELVFCEICDSEMTVFGLTVSNKVVCRSCYARCDICGDEIIGPNAAQNSPCAACGKIVCEAHAMVCTHCRERVCKDHMVTCSAGCTVCSDCARTCEECGEEIAWCMDHSFRNSKGNVTCREHAVYCVGCHEPYPPVLIQSCSRCGQTVCESCEAVCEICGCVYCLNHISQSRCSECNRKIEEGKKWQMMLF